MKPYYVAPTQAALYRNDHAIEAAALELRANKFVASLDLPTNRETTGAGGIDYYVLYQYVMQRKPKAILELGSGMTTLIMAEALATSGHGGHLWTVDHIHKFSVETKADLHPALYPIVDFTLTYVIPEQFNGTVGLRYHDLPDHEFDLIFVDGPPLVFGDIQFPSTDALHAVKRSKKPTDIIVDRRFQTLNRYSMWLKKPVLYDPVAGLGVICGLTSDDVSTIPRSAKPRLSVGSVFEALSIKLG
jgi:hypothetical protein